MRSKEAQSLEWVCRASHAQESHKETMLECKQTEVSKGCKKKTEHWAKLGSQRKILSIISAQSRLGAHRGGGARNNTAGSTALFSCALDLGLFSGYVLY